MQLRETGDPAEEGSRSSQLAVAGHQLPAKSEREASGVRGARVRQTCLQSGVLILPLWFVLHACLPWPSQSTANSHTTCIQATGSHSCRAPAFFPGGCLPPVPCTWLPAAPTPTNRMQSFPPLCPPLSSHWGFWIFLAKWAPRRYHCSPGFFSSNTKIIVRAMAAQKPHMGSRDKDWGLVHCGQRPVIFPGKGFPGPGGRGAFLADTWLGRNTNDILELRQFCGRGRGGGGRTGGWKRGSGSKNATSRGW